MVFRDRSFCAAECGTLTCYRNFSPEQQAAALAWWGKPGAPVSFSPFDKDCADQTPVATK